MTRFYTLVGRKVEEAKDVGAYMRWFMTHMIDRHVGYTQVGAVLVSTVFLGQDHSLWGGKPLLFETMVFYPDGDSKQKRYETYDEAEWGHMLFVAQEKAVVERNARVL